MTREVAHQKMFEAALLPAIADIFPPGKLPGDQALGHMYFKDSGDGGGPAELGFEFAQQHSEWGFEVEREPLQHAAEQEVL